MVDNSITAEEARHWVRALRSSLDIIYGIDKSDKSRRVPQFNILKRRKRAIKSLPISTYLLGLSMSWYVGLKMDIEFSNTRSPIETWGD